VSCCSCLLASIDVIAGQECCRELISSRASTQDITGVGYVTMELMNKEAQYDGSMIVHDVDRWPLDSKAVQFLLMTEFARSINELIKVRNPIFNLSSNISKASTV
jgi:hypothetical protein